MQIGLRRAFGERLHVHGQDGKRRPELVRDIGDEALAAQEGVGEAVQRGIDGVHQGAELLGHARLRQALVEIGRIERGCGTGRRPNAADHDGNGDKPADQGEQGREQRRQDEAFPDEIAEPGAEGDGARIDAARYNGDEPLVGLHLIDRRFAGEAGAPDVRELGCLDPDRTGDEGPRLRRHRAEAQLPSSAGSDEPEIGARLREAVDAGVWRELKTAIGLRLDVLRKNGNGHPRPNMILLVHARERPERKQPDAQRDRMRQKEPERQPPDERRAPAFHAARIM